MAKKLTKKQIAERSKKAKEAIRNKKVVQLVPDAITQIPFTTEFRAYIEETINYLFSLHSEDHTIKALQHIKTNFEHIKEDDPVDPYMNSLWTLMTIQTEMNRQAVEQGNVIVTDEDVDEATKKMIKSLETFNEDELKDMFKEVNGNYENMRKEDEARRATMTDNNSASAYDSPQSNED